MMSAFIKIKIAVVVNVWCLLVAENPPFKQQCCVAQRSRQKEPDNVYRQGWAMWAPRGAFGGPIGGGGSAGRWF